MTSSWKLIRVIFCAYAMALLAGIACPLLAHADLGDQVDNVATLSYEAGDVSLTLETNTASFIIEAATTPSTIEFFRIAGNAPDAMPITLYGSEYSPTGDTTGPFEPVTDLDPGALGTGGFPETVGIVPAEVYLSGEPIIIQVTDPGQNGDPTQVETIVATVESASGDTITLLLYEDGPDSGSFYAVFPSTADTTNENDSILTAPQDDTLTATYVDVFDATEVSVDTALVDPFGRIFDSYTGQLLDGVTVTIVDAATGLPADVFGIDGVSDYPSTVVTGSLVEDSSGRTYQLEPGQFLFPLMAPGDYRLELVVPAGYDYPSTRDQADLQLLPNAPFEIIDGSYGGTFTVDASGPINFDVPLDPSGELNITKTAAVAQASVGDFVGYTINLINEGTLAVPLNLVDELPAGFRYVSGSARLDGTEIDDPQIASDGRTLTFGGQFVLSGETSRLTYVVSVGPGTPDGAAVNSAEAFGNNGQSISNRTEAVVQIAEDLFKSRLTILGRVAEAACNTDQDWARDLEDGVGVPGVRLYMEDGRYVVTDEDGLYHFEAVEPGTHVVQVDRATLPEGYEPVICEENSRYAGSAFSKFVDAQGGTLWRANFYLAKKKPSQIKRIIKTPKTYSVRSIDEKSTAVADGEMTPVFTVEIRDAEGVPVAEGRQINLTVSEPYALKRSDAKVGGNGEVTFELEPTDQSGEVPLRVQMAEDDADYTYDVQVYLEEVVFEKPVQKPQPPAEELTNEELFNQIWLDAQSDASPRWVYPRDGESPEGRSVDLGILHGSRDRVSLHLNGLDTAAVNFAGRDLSAARTVAISRWKGVDIKRGENTFKAVIRNGDDEIVAELERKVWFVDEVEQAHLVDDQTVAVADGRTNPVIAIRLADSDGNPVHKGRIVDISVADPYRLAQEAEQEREAPITALFSNVTGVRVGKDGVAFVELEPTLQSGRASVYIELQNGRTEMIDVWLKPEKREWIVVGLAEAEGFLSNLSEDDDGDAEDLMTDGRLAFFAKGMIKGDWLLTVAVDTAKRRGSSDGEIFDEIDPNAYYTLYGDRTWQYNDAESRYPVYVKLEKNMFQALFGDFETDLNQTELGRYSRRLTGIKADYEGEQISVTAFAAETNQTFQKDEIAADGTSGPYILKQAPLIRSSEVITIETRERFRPDQVLLRRPLTRFIDYDIDYETGELFFRQPVDATDSSLNPNVIVIDYETSQAAERGVTAGGRASLRTKDDRAEIGVTALHEEDTGLGGNTASDLVSVDARFQVNSAIEVRAEAATSTSDTDTGSQDGDAWLVEGSYAKQGVSAIAYLREEAGAFGLGQQGSNTSGLRRVGAQASAELGVIERADGNDRSIRSATAEVYREEDLETGARRDLAEIALEQSSNTRGGRIGLRQVSEEFGSADVGRESTLLTLGGHATFIDHGLTVSVTHDQPIGGSGDEDANDDVTLFPQRTTLGVDKDLGRRAKLSVRHEISDGGNGSGDTTVAGITYTPWTGGEFRALTDQVTSDSGRRLGATVGVDQNWQINQNWSVSGGLARRANIDGGDTPLDAFADDAISPLEDGVRSTLAGEESYTSAYAGAGYRANATAIGTRVEIRNSEQGDRLTVFGGAARELSETLSFTGAAQYQNDKLADVSDTESLDIRLGAAYRPRGEGVIVLNRFDISHDKVENTLNSTKLVNNLGLNTMLTKRTQLALYHGLKYAKTEFEGAEASGWTHLLGGEVRHDVTRKLDLGLHGYVWHGETTGTTEWAFGPSIGYSPAKNVWASLGYNIQGFKDEDFEAAEYTRDGVFLKVRAKFDQDTVKGLINDLGLGTVD